TPMDDQHASPAGTETVEDETLDSIASLCRGEAVEVEMGLPREVASSQPADHPGIEPYYETLDVLARIGDVEARDPGHQVGERGQRLRFLAHRSRVHRRGRRSGDPAVRPACERDNPVHGRGEEHALVRGRSRCRRTANRERGWRRWSGVPALT